MNLPELRRQVFWLMPGLFIKRWIVIAIAGFAFALLGLALMMNMQPVAFMIDILKKLALLIPSYISGPSLFLAGTVLFYLGWKKVSNTVVSALQDEGGDANILEAIYRRSKLIHGPRIVAIGGGTGLSTLLRGLKHHTANITAIVTVGDDGGSSGRLREEHGVIPPGDIRNCIAALADDDQLLTELFQYRFKAGMGLEGHSFGNLFLTAMCQVTGDMFSAIKESSRVLNIRGRVIPSTLANVRLVAEMEDGREIMGESNIPEARGRIRQLRCEPRDAHPLPEALKAIEQAELVIMGPGSLYTSVVPNLLIDEIAEAISKTDVPKLYIANIMTQPGETDGYTVADHLEVLFSHSRYPNIVNAVFVNNWLPEKLLTKYRDAGYQPVELDEERCRAMDVNVIQGTLVNENETERIRHNPRRLAQAITLWLKRRQLQKKAVTTITTSVIETSPEETEVPAEQPAEDHAPERLAEPSLNKAKQ